MTRREFVAASALGVVMPRLMAEPVTPAQVGAFAKLALKGIQKEYPNKPEHVLSGPEDAKTPRALHPAFYGCYDWHSSVHGHWMLARLLRTMPELPSAAYRNALNDNITAENIRSEVAYFE